MVATAALSLRARLVRAIETQRPGTASCGGRSGRLHEQGFPVAASRRRSWGGGLGDALHSREGAVMVLFQ